MAELTRMDVFRLLAMHYGPMHWWPAETAFEVCVGAILTQNTAWTNVEKAITALKQAGVLHPAGIHEIGEPELALLIRPSGFFNVKSRRLKSFVRYLYMNHAGSLERMFQCDWRRLRDELLEVNGLGPETCDSMLLYAGEKPTFVVDSYTRRLFGRLGLQPHAAGYEETRRSFMAELPEDVTLFNEYHALIVEQCKQFCKSKPICEGCPLGDVCQRIIS